MEVVLIHVGYVARDKLDTFAKLGYRCLPLPTMCDARYLLEKLAYLGGVEKVGDRYVVRRLLDEDLVLNDLPEIRREVEELRRHGCGRVSISVASFMDLANEIWIENRRLVENPGHCSAVIPFARSVVETIARSGIEMLVVVDRMLSTIAKSYELDYGYKRMYVEEAYSYILEPFNEIVAVYLPGKPSELAIEILCSVPEIDLLILDASYATKILDTYVENVLKESRKGLVMALDDRSKDLRRLVDTFLDHGVVKGFATVALEPSTSIDSFLATIEKLVKSLEIA